MKLTKTKAKKKERKKYKQIKKLKTKTYAHKKLNQVPHVISGDVTPKDKTKMSSPLA